jgi:hypothetical protein
MLRSPNPSSDLLGFKNLAGLGKEAYLSYPELSLLSSQWNSCTIKKDLFNEMLITGLFFVLNDKISHSDAAKLCHKRG